MTMSTLYILPVYMGCGMQKRVFGHIWTAKLKITIKNYMYIFQCQVMRLSIFWPHVITGLVNHSRHTLYSRNVAASQPNVNSYSHDAVLMLASKYKWAGTREKGPFDFSVCGTFPIATDRRRYPHNIFLISRRKHMLWVLIRSASVRRL